jgi:imidazole glycerol phosphate synthase glutamine amidotransferase subunit
MNALQVTLIDYGAGNLPSVERALRLLGADTLRASEPAALASSRAIVLPGVGHFGALMRALDGGKMLAPLREAICRGVPFLGICLGLQALYTMSEEDPSHAGLGILPGRIQPLPKTAKLPHMGWNQVRRQRSSVLLRNVSEDAYFYFAHSYAALEASQSAVAICEHGVPFVAALEQGSVLAVQFHPEKSGEPGAKVLANYLEYARQKSPAGGAAG